jgi:hypothetical protein
MRKQVQYQRPLSRSLGRVGAVLEVVAAAAIAGVGGGGADVNVDAPTSILRFKILPAS